jgi:NADH-quinone oxidoreductase subunit G
VFPPGDAKEDWAVIRALSAHAGHQLPYDTLPALRAAMHKAAPALARIDTVEAAEMKGVEALAARSAALGTEPFGSAVADFYLTNPIARASAVMAELSALKQSLAASLGQSLAQGTTGTHG